MQPSETKSECVLAFALRTALLVLAIGCDASVAEVVPTQQPDSGVAQDAAVGEWDSGVAQDAAVAEWDGGVADATIDAADVSACAAFVPVTSTEGGKRDIEFVAFGDTQFALTSQGCAPGPRAYRGDQNAKMIDAINNIEQYRWPTGFGLSREGQSFGSMRGVLIAGDITENGSEPFPEFSGQVCPELQHFTDAYGLCAERSLRYPVYEGYGNHDFPFRESFTNTHHPVVEAIGRRNALRPSVVHAARDEEGHYAWVWDDVHFINLNVKPAGTRTHEAFEDIDKGPTRKRRVDPHRALDYLSAYLASNNVGAKTQVVLMTHYGPSNTTRLSKLERKELCAVLDAQRAQKGVRVVAWLHGHTHRSDYYHWSCPAPFEEITMPVFNVGSPYYAARSNGGRVHFAVFRLGNHRLEAVHVSAPGSGVLEVPGYSESHSGREPRYNPDGVWGGWAVSLDHHLRAPN